MCRSSEQHGRARRGNRATLFLLFLLFLLCAREGASMTTGPGDELAAGAPDRSRMRASHADREHVIGTLKAAFVQGRVTKGELVVRVGQALDSRTYAELAALTADIPAGAIGAQPPRVPARASAKVAMACAAGIIVPTLLVVVAFLTNTEPHLVLKRLMVITLIGWLAVAVKRYARHQGRSGRQLPPQPGQRGRLRQGEQHGGAGDDLLLCEVHGDAPARYVPRHRIIQHNWRSLRVRRGPRRPARLQVTA